MPKHCCAEMTKRILLDCQTHHDPFECPDVLINYIERFEEYGIIIHDGGSSSISICYCPWCGTKLPSSKRDLWFDTLENMGFDDPGEQDIPEQFNSNKWLADLKVNVSSP
ncbi:hypothetical protein O4H49_16795 [Kiloniella laminariae]|uniref:DUF6980 domain-containing protein n=1 Tax=Kiloniella laminariae TaxID=454162 RepID=A0ABT4LR79_9PROT|nr:hypothetical protein [Kiloniella laminariae]MCZ4282447.1 hypothetical protein [Kiloniella laminariae]